MSIFSQAEANDLLARCHRRCCICHRYCGVKIELDHIEPRSTGGSEEIANAIPVCFECHAEIHSYNDEHPRGRKFRPDELRRHKEQWLRLVMENPGALVAARPQEDVGPLQSLIDELEFNLSVSTARSDGQAGCLFLDTQFQRALAAGSIAILEPELKSSLLEAYRVTMKANHVIPQAAVGYPTRGVRKTYELLPEAEALIQSALGRLLEFLGREERRESGQ
jgi:hypothetical protein